MYKVCFDKSGKSVEHPERKKVKETSIVSSKLNEVSFFYTYFY